MNKTETIFQDDFRPTLEIITGANEPRNAQPMPVQMFAPIPYEPEQVEYRPIVQEVVVRHVHSFDAASILAVVRAFAQLLKPERKNLEAEMRKSRDLFPLCFVPNTPAPVQENPVQFRKVETGGDCKNLTIIYGGNVTVNNF